MPERADEPLVVALVQADAGLVEHVHHARQAAADLAGQADALRLAAAQRVGAAVQAQVRQADVVEEAQPAADLAHDLVGDLGLGAEQLQALEVGQAGGQGGVLDLVDRAALAAIGVLQEDMPRLASQPRAMALRAGLFGLVARELLAHGRRIGLAETTFEVGQDAFERMPALDAARPALGARRAAFGLVDELDGLVARTVQQHLARRGGQLLERGLDVEAVMPGHALQQRVGVDVAPIPALDGTRGQAQRREGDHPLGVEHRDLAQPVAGRAGAHRRVEAEQARLELGQRIAAHRAAELAAEQVFAAAVHLQRDRAAVGDAQGRLEALREPLLDVGLAAQAVDDDVDVVLVVLLQRRQGLGLDDLARPAIGADAEAHVAARLHVLRTDRRTRPCGRAPRGRAPSAACPRAARAPRRPSG